MIWDNTKLLLGLLYRPVSSMGRIIDEGHWLYAAVVVAALSMICTVVPGTVWSELALDRSILLLHVFDLDDESQFIQHFKTTYERPLMEIFE